MHIPLRSGLLPDFAATLVQRQQVLCSGAGTRHNVTVDKTTRLIASTPSPGAYEPPQHRHAPGSRCCAK